MLIECSNCYTKFNLADSLVPDEGAWLRCSRCGEVFNFQPPDREPKVSQVFSPSIDSPRPGVQGFEHGALADFGLGVDESAPAKKRGGFFRLLLWLLITLLILAVLAVGALVVLDRLGMKREWIDPLRNLPLLQLIISKPAASPSTLSLNNVRAYYRDNQHAGRLFIIQGEVVNLSSQTQVNVLVQGRLNDINNNPARQAVIYAGPVFNPEELRELSLAQIQAQLSQPQDSAGQPYMLPPQGSLPFMIVLANLPDNISDYTVDVVGWEVANK